MTEKRIRLTTAELEAILGVAGDALAEESLKEPDQTEEEHEAACYAFETGMEKLRVMLGRRKRRGHPG